MMQSPKRLYQFLIVMCVFAIAFGAWMYYLQYEGVPSYQYYMGDLSPRTLFPNQAEIVETQEDQYHTAYSRDLTMTFALDEQRINAVRVLLSGVPETHSFLAFEGVTADNEVVQKTLLNQRGKSEFLFHVPDHIYSKISICLNHYVEVDSVEIYEQGIFVDESKSIPRVLNMGISVLLSLLLAEALLLSKIQWKEGKGFGFLLLYLPFEIGALRYILKTRSYPVYSQEIELTMWAFFVLASLTMFAVYRMLFVHHSSLHMVFALCSMTMGLMMLLLIQPLAVPDEGTHYYQAYIRSNEMMRKSALREHEIRFEDLQFIEMNERLGNMIRYEKYPVLAEALFEPAATGKTKLFVREGKIESVPLGYMFSGLGLTIARVLCLNGAQAFYLGRFVNMLMYIGMITLVIYWLPFGKAAALVLALAPVSMQQAASYSYDPIVMAISFLFVAYTLKLYAQEKSISIHQYIITCVLAVLLGPSKAVYAPLSLSILLIPAKKYGFGKRKWVLNIFVIFLAFFALFAMQMKNILRISAPQQAVASAEVAKYSISYLLANLRETINLFLTDYELHGGFYYRYFFCELLGWHQLNAYSWLTMMFCVLFIWGCQRVEGETDIFVNQWKRLGAMVVLLGVITIIQLTLLMDWTPFGSKVILGVQGRYFIPALIVLIPVLRNAQVKVKDNAHRWCAFLGIWACMFAIISLLMVMPK